MAKTKVSEYDSTAANNTDIDSINIAEGMAPSNVNNAIRQLMAHLKTEFFKTGTANTSLGDGALDSLDGSSPGGSNVAIGKDAGTALTTGGNNTAVGALAADALTTGDGNVVMGYAAGGAATTTDHSVLIGYEAGGTGTLTGHDNVFIGMRAGKTGTSVNSSIAIGREALSSITTGVDNVCIGMDAGKALVNGNYNTAVGTDALVTEDGHGKNVAVGWSTLKNLNSGVTGLDGENVAVGYDAGRNTNLGVYNTFVGSQAGQANTAGDNNTFIGRGSGSAVTTGDNNTILGRFNGNQARADGATLDIRTSDNNIVLSDGAGNPRCYWDSAGTMRNINDQSAGFNAYFKNDHSSAYVLGVETGSSSLVFFYGSGGAGVGTITTNGSTTSYNTSSDYRLKENVVDITGATERLKQLQPRRFNFIGNTDLGTVDGFLAHEAQTVVPEAVTGTKDQTESIGDVTDGDGNTIETGVLEPDTLKEGHTWAETGTRPVYQGIDHGKLVPLLVATIKELEARIAALEAE